MSGVASSRTLTRAQFCSLFGTSFVGGCVVAFIKIDSPRSLPSLPGALGEVSSIGSLVVAGLAIALVASPAKDERRLFRYLTIVTLVPAAYVFGNRFVHAAVESPLGSVFAVLLILSFGALPQPLFRGAEQLRVARQMCEHIGCPTDPRRRHCTQPVASPDTGTMG